MFLIGVGTDHSCLPQCLLCSHDVLLLLLCEHGIVDARESEPFKVLEIAAFDLAHVPLHDRVHLAIVLLLCLRLHNESLHRMDHLDLIVHVVLVVLDH